MHRGQTVAVGCMPSGPYFMEIFLRSWFLRFAGCISRGKHLPHVSGDWVGSEHGTDPTDHVAGCLAFVVSSQLRRVFSDHCNHCNSSNHLSVHQWIRSAIRDSQQPTSPIGFLCLKLPPAPCAVLLVYLPLHAVRVILTICSDVSWA